MSCLTRAPRRAVGIAAAGVLAAGTLALGACRMEKSAEARTRDGRFGLGHAAPDELIARQAIAIPPSGAGLPAGRGSADQGAAVYAQKCAMCHGARGEGMPPAFPQLVGREPRAGFPFGRDPKLPRTIGNYWPYATTLFDYVRRAMPYTAPGSLTDDEVYAVTAYLLAQNEVIPRGAVLDARTLPQVRMPARDRFVLDDRRGGREVR